ncbi:hypothetical protein RO3G_15930 [Rhizopus delemar RA 99-880]|uniref:Uncharacterized protein n=1 Tax=Rhizopus delemar (strain RA 99-880 / ATCC MYA-4621 / FGSC 9543 / NRRL 43880) TaxID=246409 RepID=I1CRY9_RHIO9|nr:hypothetical protein RO3G_15930 [Rhizopus delemar RA 99-880]|eukprot:EIE91219.1 hypothetical protein RO3G_15930 [Rhizopus delemar RA 99-880]
MPDFLYKVLIFTLQSSFDAPSHVIPLIFKHSRSYGNMKGLHPLIPMFSALDSYPRLPTENDLTIASQTSLLIPFKDICEEDPQEKFKFSKFLRAQKAYHFFRRDFLSNGIQFKNRQHCDSPNILQKIKMLFLLETLPSSRILHLYYQLNSKILNWTMKNIQLNQISTLAHSFNR